MAVFALQLGVVAIETGKLHLALAYFDAAIHINPDHPVMTNRLSRLTLTLFIYSKRCLISQLWCRTPEKPSYSI